MKGLSWQILELLRGRIVTFRLFSLRPTSIGVTEIAKGSGKSPWLKSLVILFVSVNCLSAATFGLFTYTDNGPYITITDYPTTEVGAVTIPAIINYKPVTTIANGAFLYCSYLTGITIPASVSNIGSNAFQQCNGLTSITVDAPNPFYSSVGGILFNKDQTTLVYFPGGKIGSYSIPDGVTSIGNDAFYYCNGLTSVTLPFSVTSIGSSAFHSCITLTSVNIPINVTSIGSFAFQSCSALTSVNIPASITSVGINAFQQCSGLISITVNALNPAYSSKDGVLFNRDRTTLITCPGGKTGSYSIPESVISIAAYAFYYCRGLTSVNIPVNVTSIGSSAFYSCSALTSVIIPSSIDYIESGAFSQCSKLIRVFFKGNAPYLGGSALPGNVNAFVYYVLGTLGWSSNFGGLATIALGPPTITAPLSSVSANIGQNIGFSVTAVSSTLLPARYVWKKDGITMAEFSSAELNLDAINSSDFGTYSVVVSNDSGSVTSNAILSPKDAYPPGILYTQTQYEAALQMGFDLGLQANDSDVLTAPNSYGLYSLNQVQALYVDAPLLAKDPVTGKFTLTLGLRKSANLIQFAPFPMTAPETRITGNGRLEFTFSSTDAAAFYQIQAN